MIGRVDDKLRALISVPVVATITDERTDLSVWAGTSPGRSQQELGGLQWGEPYRSPRYPT